jgi:hypothetical protein
MQALYQLSYSPSTTTAARRWRLASVQDQRGRWSQPTSFTRPYEQASAGTVSGRR